MGTKSGQHDSRTSFNLFYNFALCIIPLEVMHIPNAVIGGWYNVIFFKSNLVNRRVNIASRRFVHNLGNIEMAILHSTYTLQAFEQCRCTSPMTNTRHGRSSNPVPLAVADPGIDRRGAPIFAITSTHHSWHLML